jgi:hypothetical protein
VSQRWTILAVGVAAQAALEGEEAGGSERASRAAAAPANLEAV